MRHRRMRAAGCAAILLTLAACGSGSDGASGPADEAVATSSPADGVADPTADEGVEPTVEPAVEQGSAAPAVTDGAATEGTAPEPAVTESPGTETGPPEAAAPAEPVVGGRLFATEVQPEAELDSNPFPDLVVDDIGKDADVNIRNILPSDRPVLLWAWAPH